MEKRRKLNVELIKFLIGSMLVVGVLMLLGSSLVSIENSIMIKRLKLRRRYQIR